MPGTALIELPASPAWAWLARGGSLLAVSALLAWWAGPPPEVDPRYRLLLSGLALACCGWPWLQRFAPGGRLRCGPAGCALALQGADWRSGHLVVALDLGAGMLLRFDPAGSELGRGRTWLAVDRRAVGAGWHALRCAVYSAPPLPVTDLPAERRTPPRTPLNRPNERP